ncbi:hypothetical protein BGW41_004377 [Actinomortierella wolfii]|nr:hypothetical protein BGW41_004377 [Actinomortierella wolfii]
MLLWSFILASFTSPGYPSEILEKTNGRSKRSIYDGDSVHDDVHVGLLEHGQYSLTHSPISVASGTRPYYPHSPGTTGDAMGAADEAVDAYERRERESVMAHLESPYDHGHRVSDAWGQHYRPSRQSLHPPPFASPSSSSHSHTVVNMMTGDDCTDSTTLRNASVEVDDNTPLGMTAQRFTVKRDGSMRYCQKCNSSCKRCVLKMDHHCPWLNNCVGHKNHKAFYLFVLWTAVYCVTIVTCTIPVAADAFSRPYNKTTIESFEKHKYRMGSTGEVLQSRMLNVFDVGAKRNFVQVLGPVWYLWFIPVRNSLGDGWSFPANEYGKNLLRSTQQDVYSGHSTLGYMRQQVIARLVELEEEQKWKDHGLPLRSDAASPAFSTTTSCTSTTTSASELPELPHQTSSSQNHQYDSDLDENAYHRRDSDSDPDDHPRFRPRTPRRKFYRRYQGYMYNSNNNGGINSTSPSTHPRPGEGAGSRSSGVHGDDDDDDYGHNRNDDEQDIEPEEYIYDSDEQATIRFTER